MPSAAHPRSRGEHAPEQAHVAPEAGSSPLARGTLVLLHLSRGNRRLIPARAGNTLLTAEQGGRHAAHPRSRGEHSPAMVTDSERSGSSPLARGTRQVMRAVPEPVRLIPARAGNTFSSTSCAHLPAAHPRSRGEHKSLDSEEIETFGSSPLARGTPKKKRE